MALLDSLTRQAGRIAGDVQHSIKRARLEGERRLLQRSHRSALEALGERVFELVRSGRLPEGELAPQIAEVESKLLEIQAKVAEIDGLRPDDGDDPRRDDGEVPALPAGARRRTGWEAAERYFPKG